MSLPVFAGCKYTLSVALLIIKYLREHWAHLCAVPEHLLKCFLKVLVIRTQHMMITSPNTHHLITNIMIAQSVCNTYWQSRTDFFLLTKAEVHSLSKGKRKRNGFSLFSLFFCCFITLIQPTVVYFVVFCNLLVSCTYVQNICTGVSSLETYCKYN